MSNYITRSKSTKGTEPKETSTILNNLLIKLNDITTEIDYRMYHQSVLLNDILNRQQILLR